MTARETNLVNAFETTLDGAIASGANSGIALTDNPGVAAPVYLVFDPDNDSKREVVLWNSGAFGSMSVTRDVDAKHGTDPEHADGTKVRLAVVKQHIEEAHDAIQQGFVLEDDDGTEVTINPAVSSGVYTAREVKFIGSGITTNWTDTSDGTDGDPYDLTFTNDIIGKQSIWVPATAMYPTNTGGCAAIALTETTAARPDMYTLDFDASSDENAQFSVAFPSYWNEGTITYQAYWTTTATDTDGVAWSLAGVAVSDNDTIDVAFGTAVVVTDDALGAAEDLMVTAESGAVTIAGSPAAGDLCYFNIERDVSDANDDMAEDAKLIGIKLFYTIDDVHEA